MMGRNIKMAAVAFTSNYNVDRLRNKINMI